MSKTVDLTGRRIGMLTVLRLAQPDEIPEQRRDKRGTYWLCRCDCGRLHVSSSDSLRLSRSCGCTHGKSRKGVTIGPHQDITGQVYNELTAVSYVGMGVWRWRCSCGAMCDYKITDVRRGIVVSCGHVVREIKRNAILSHNVFGFYDGTSISKLRRILDGTYPTQSPVGVAGVTIRRYAARVAYVATIDVKGKRIRLGQYDDLDDAIRARKAAEIQYYLPIVEAYDAQNSTIGDDSHD